ncbi:efflux RND transporter periplasmic adaptor subunit [Denitromonas sp.]|uniref:efflux RND transporter periplasmic adaptor subunit n=1 Tax=Denitromonas sp. TaxID=2734609 RepID=UPI002AFEDE12|nr:efflux RND transporter periplasmic adaptor subunit [Denitromonas sp.]
MMSFRFLAVCALLPWAAQAAELTTRPLSELAVYPVYRVNATANPVDEAQLGLAVAGRIEALPVRVGETVRRGSPLVTLDAREYRIERDRAKAQLDLVASQLRLAETQLAQNRALAQRDFLSADALRVKETELAVRKNELAATRQGLAAAELALSRTTLVAPFDGVVRSRLASVGDYVSPGAPVVVLAASATPEVRASVPVSQIASVRAAKAWVLDAAGLEVPLALKRVSPLVDRAAQAQDVVFAPTQAMPIGLAGEVRWAGGQPMLPPAYVQKRDGVFGVYVMDGGTPRFRPLPGAQQGRPVPVPGDWSMDLAVVDEGRFQIGLKPVEAAQ